MGTRRVRRNKSRKHLVKNSRNSRRQSRRGGVAHLILKAPGAYMKFKNGVKQAKRAYGKAKKTAKQTQEAVKRLKKQATQLHGQVKEAVPTKGGRKKTKKQKSRRRRRSRRNN